MFPEYRDLITRLKTEDAHFTRLFDKHNAIDQQIKNMEARIEPGSPEEIENAEKRKAAPEGRALHHSAHRRRLRPAARNGVTE